MPKIQLVEGTKLEIELDVDKKNQDKLNLVSQFEWRESEDIICVAAPIYKGNYYYICTNTLMRVYFLFDNDMYMFTAKQMDNFTRDNFKYMRLRKLSEFLHVQRREFYRFTCLLPIMYRRYDTQNKSNNDTPFILTEISNISGGGLCIKTKEKLAYDDMIECKLELEDYGEIPFLAKVVREEPIKNESRYKYEYGVEYTGIVSKDKEAIIAYIFRQQRKLREKGII